MDPLQLKLLEGKSKDQLSNGQSFDAFKADIFSLGLVFLESIIGDHDVTMGLNKASTAKEKAQKCWESL